MPLLLYRVSAEDNRRISPHDGRGRHRRRAEAELRQRPRQTETETGDRDGDRIPYGAIRRGPDTNRHKCHRSMYTDMACTHTQAHTCTIHAHTLYASAYLYIDSLMKSGILGVSIITTKRRSCCKFPHMYIRMSGYVRVCVCVCAICVW